MVKRKIKEESGIDMLGVGAGGGLEGHTCAEFSQVVSHVHGWEGSPC